jgi:hypothetical protein
MFSAELRNEYKCEYLLKVDKDDYISVPVPDRAQSFIPDATSAMTGGTKSG